MVDCTCIMRLERARDPEGLRDDADHAICTTEEDALGARYYRSYITGLRIVRKRISRVVCAIPLIGMSSRLLGA